MEIRSYRHFQKNSYCYLPILCSSYNRATIDAPTLDNTNQLTSEPVVMTNVSTIYVCGLPMRSNKSETAEGIGAMTGAKNRFLNEYAA